MSKRVRMHRRHPAVVLLEPMERRALLSSVVVTTLADGGAGSLRQAVADAHAGDTVDFVALSGTLTLGTPIAIDKDLTIAGSGAGELTISGGHASRGFEVVPGHAVSFRDLTIDACEGGDSNYYGSAITVYDSNGGNVASSLDLLRVNLTNNHAKSLGGALFLDRGTLAMTDCLVTGNSVSGTTSAIGGAVHIGDGSFALAGNTFAGNSAVAVDTNGMMGGYGNAGAFFARVSAASSFVNTTFADNLAKATSTSTFGFSDSYAVGGAIKLNLGAPLTIANTTIAGNHTYSDATQAYTSAGAGLFIEGYNASGPITMLDTIVAGNDATLAGGGPGATADFKTFVPLTVTYSLIGDDDGNGVVDGADGNRSGTTAAPLDAKLGALADNGGPTPTLALLAGSPAVDAGTDVGATPLDQRGIARNGATDIGAYEIAAATPTPDPTPDPDPTPTPDPTPEPATIELIVTGTDGADQIRVWTRLKGTQLRTVVDGRIRNYDAARVTSLTINAGGGDDSVSINAGTLGAVVYGGAGADTIVGGAGDDTLDGNGSADVIYGGDGNDRLLGHGGNDRLFGGDGRDRLYGGDGADVLTGGDGLDRLYGEGGRDQFFAADGATDHVYGQAADGDRFHGDARDVLAELLAALD